MFDTSFKTNAERATALGLKPAPTLRGYLLGRTMAENIIGHNKRIAAGEEKGQIRLGVVYIETTRKCNLHCPFCYTDAIYAKDGAKEELTLDEMKEGVAVAHALGAGTMAIAGAGEPFLDKNLFGILEFTRAKGMEVVLFTNGTLIRKDIARELKGLDITVVAKVPAITPMVQDEVVGVRGAHKRMMTGFFTLLEAGFRAPRLGAEAVITRQNAEEMGTLLRYTRYVDAVPFFETLEALGRGCTVIETLALAHDGYLALFNRLREIDEVKHGLAWVILDGTRVVAHEVDRKRLYGIRIGANADVLLFANEDNNMGNMRETPIGRILEKPDALLRLYRREFGLN